MRSIGDLRKAFADETTRRQLAEARLADCQRQLAQAHETIVALTQLAASKPGLTEVGVIAPAALLSTLDIADAPPTNGAAAVTAR